MRTTSSLLPRALLNVRSPWSAQRELQSRRCVSFECFLNKQMVISLSQQIGEVFVVLNVAAKRRTVHQRRNKRPSQIQFSALPLLHAHDQLAQEEAQLLPYHMLLSAPSAGVTEDAEPLQPQQPRQQPGHGYAELYETRARVAQSPSRGSGRYSLRHHSRGSSLLDESAAQEEDSVSAALQLHAEASRVLNESVDAADERAATAPSSVQVAASWLSEQEAVGWEGLHDGEALPISSIALQLYSSTAEPAGKQPEASSDASEVSRGDSEAPGQAIPVMEAALPIDPATPAVMQEAEALQPLKGDAVVEQAKVDTAELADTTPSSADTTPSSAVLAGAKIAETEEGVPLAVADVAANKPTASLAGRSDAKPQAVVMVVATAAVSTPALLEEGADTQMVVEATPVAETALLEHAVEAVVGAAESESAGAKEASAESESSPDKEVIRDELLMLAGDLRGWANGCDPRELEADPLAGEAEVESGCGSQAEYEQPLEKAQEGERVPEHEWTGPSWPHCLEVQRLSGYLPPQTMVVGQRAPQAQAFFTSSAQPQADPLQRLLDWRLQPPPPPPPPHRAVWASRPTAVPRRKGRPAPRVATAFLPGYAVNATAVTKRLFTTKSSQRRVSVRLRRCGHGAGGPALQLALQSASDFEELLAAVSAAAVRGGLAMEQAVALYDARGSPLESGAQLADGMLVLFRCAGDFAPPALRTTRSARAQRQALVRRTPPHARCPDQRLNPPGCAV